MRCLLFICYYTKQDILISNPQIQNCMRHAIADDIKKAAELNENYQLSFFISHQKIHKISLIITDSKNGRWLLSFETDATDKTSIFLAENFFFNPQEGRRNIIKALNLSQIHSLK